MWIYPTLLNTGGGCHFRGRVALRCMGLMISFVYLLRADELLPPNPHAVY